MNDGFLDADCVINYIVSIGIIKKAAWKHEKTRELFYPSRFYHAETNATISLQIDVVNTLHCISKSQIRLLSKIQKVDLSSVFQKCAI